MRPLGSLRRGPFPQSDSSWQAMDMFPEPPIVMVMLLFGWIHSSCSTLIAYVVRRVLYRRTHLGANARQ